MLLSPLSLTTSITNGFPVSGFGFTAEAGCGNTLVRGAPNHPPTTVSSTNPSARGVANLTTPMETSRRIYGASMANGYGIQRALNKSSPVTLGMEMVRKLLPQPPLNGLRHPHLGNEPHDVRKEIGFRDEHLAFWR